MRNRTENGTTRQEEVKALLLSYNTQPVWKIGNEIVTGIGADHIRFPELPQTLYSRPTLIWTVQNGGAAKHRVEASYLASRLAWNADYVLTVGRDDKAADLNGWVTLVNDSGTAFRNARLQLVAGDLNRVRQQLGKMEVDERRDAAAPAANQMVQESFSDYHLYTMQRKTTINNAQTKQVSLLEGTDVPTTKRYVVEGQNYYYHNSQHPGAPIKDLVQVYYQFKNEAKSGLGIPMPAGVLRVYQQDSKGGVQFVGEDRIMHTPKDETLNIKIGNAFDVVCERKQIDFTKISSNVYEFEYEITLRNHKATAVSVEVNEPIGGTWRMLRSSHEWTKTSAWAAQFNVPVASDGTAVLNIPRARRLRGSWVLGHGLHSGHMKVLGASLTALLILAACDQAERAIGSAVGPRKAIAELKYAGDRPDVPPLEERGNAQFTTRPTTTPARSSSRKPGSAPRGCRSGTPRTARSSPASMASSRTPAARTSG